MGMRAAQIHKAGALELRPAIRIQRPKPTMMAETAYERAKRQGKRFGRPERLDAGQKRVIAELYGKGKTIPELAVEYEVGVGTIWRALQPEASEAA